MKLFKNTANAVTSVNKVWDMSNDIIPVPKKELPCSVCGSKTMTLRTAMYHNRETSPNKFRCVVHFKCMTCSHIDIFGVVISDTMFFNAEKEFGLRKKIDWRVIKKTLENLNK